jgi:hypothetical protein
MINVYVPRVELEFWRGAMDWNDDQPAALVGMADAMSDGSWWTPYKERTMSESESGNVYEKFAELRKQVGVLKAKVKQGVKFKVRSADELADRVRPEADRLGLLIYPVGVEAKGHVVDSGTLAEATVTLRIKSISDGSYFDVVGFGLGADNQDKAGGKAGTYAWKSALVQALIAGGEKDTDDSDTPIQGGVRPRPPAGAARPAVPGKTPEEVRSMVAEAAAAKDGTKLRAAIDAARGLNQADQDALTPAIREAAAAIRGAA